MKFFVLLGLLMTQTVFAGDLVTCSMHDNQWKELGQTSFDLNTGEGYVESPIESKNNTVIMITVRKSPDTTLKFPILIAQVVNTKIAGLGLSVSTTIDTFLLLEKGFITSVGNYKGETTIIHCASK